MTILERPVIQANPLIAARKQMNVSEMRLFLLGLQDVHPRLVDDMEKYDIDFHETLITPSQLREIFGDNTGSIANLKKHVKKAFDAIIELTFEDGGFELMHIYQILHYKKDEGLHIKFDDLMKPYILDLLNKQYTRYKMKEVFSLSSEYGWRIMELLQSNSGFFKESKKIFVDLSLDELRFALNIPDGAYSGRIGNLKKFVLDTPIGEINEKTPYLVWYEQKKTGRNITGFRFWMRKKNEEEEQQREEADEQRRDQEDHDALEKSEALQLLTSHGVTLFRAKNLVKKYGEERCKVNFNIAKAAHDDGKVDNLPAYICSAIEKDYAKGDVLFEQEQQRQKQERDARNEAIAAAGSAALQKEYDENLSNSDLSPEWKAKLAARKEQSGQIVNSIVDNKKME